MAKTFIMGTDALFENYTIEEIQEIEKKTKMEIERKKEELRQMVGERYRDLMEAADTIQAMRTSASSITSCIKNMVNLCENLPNQAKKSSHVEAHHGENAHYHEIGAQIKLLLDIPKEIWSYIDNKNYLAATELYLLARHIHSSLQLLPLHGMSIQKNFPIVNRQWSVISHFRPSILESCHNMLKEAILDEKKMAENLVALMLLEGTTPRQVFNQFLLARTKSLQDMFSSDKDGMVAKEQICNVTKLILDTVYLIHALFYNSNDVEDVSVKNLLRTTLNYTTSHQSKGPLKLMNLDSPVMKYLPQVIRGFRPVCVVPALNITDKEIETSCHDWIDTVTSDVLKGFTRILTYVNSIRGLSSIRNSAWKLLDEDNRKESWDNICNCVLKKSLNIWKEFMHPVFLSRIKAIIKSHLDGAINYTSQSLERSLNNILDSDHDLSSFIWSKSITDGIDGRNWLNSSNKPIAECGQLAMKANGFMPIVQKLCSGLNSRLTAFLDDFKFYVVSKDTVEDNDLLVKSAQSLDYSVQTITSLSDNEYLFKYLQDQTVNCLERLLNFVHQSFALNGDKVPKNMYRYALLARFTIGLADLCPQLQLCLNYSLTLADTGTATVMKRMNKGDNKEQDKWNEMKSKMKAASLQGCRLWSATVTDDLHQKFEETCVETGGFSINHQPLWNDIEIQEENEDGVTVKSKIKVPSQISRNLLKTLMDLCTILSQVGGHVMNKSITHETVSRLCNKIIDVYEIKASPSLRQTEAMQLLFNVKFVMMLFMPKENERIQMLIDQIENQIDPFDLDVFNPHIHTNLKRYIQGSMVMLGLIIPSDKSTLFNGTRVSSAQDQHNVLPLSCGHNSFSLLPISDAIGNKNTASGSSVNRLSLKNSSKDDKARSASPSPTRRRDQPSNSGMGQKSQSFYDRMTAMSSSWFGGQ